ncbi:MAG: hypothetical protein AB7I35_12220 [Ramlibacter sp.]
MRVWYTRLLFWADGFTLCQGLILLHPRVRNDAALLEHEKAHVAQMRRDGTLCFWWRYLTSAKARLDYEAQAYSVQLRYAPGSLQTFAAYLSNNYALGISQDQARAAIESKT